MKNAVKCYHKNGNRGKAKNLWPYFDLSRKKENDERLKINQKSLTRHTKQIQCQRFFSVFTMFAWLPNKNHVQILFALALIAQLVAMQNVQ